MTLMIALVGEQPLPNFLLAQHEHPDALLMIYTLKTEFIYKKLKATLQSKATIYGLLTDPYNVIDIIKDLKVKLAEKEIAACKPFVLNLTGGTKAMSLAAYHVAQHYNASVIYLESEERRNQVFRYKWEQQQLQLIDSKKLSECTELEDFFNLHFGPKKWTRKKPDNQPGSIFQKAVADTLQAQGYEIMLGIQAMQGQVDIDVAIRFENQFGIIETKLGKKGRDLEGIQQLSTAKRHLGTFTQQLYVITVPRTPVHTEIIDAANIKVISLLEYEEGATSLSPNDTKELIKQVGEVLKE